MPSGDVLLGGGLANVKLPWPKVIKNPMNSICMNPFISFFYFSHSKYSDEIEIEWFCLLFFENQVLDFHLDYI